MKIEQSAIVQFCPSCGRPMKVQAKYVGKPVRCGHCGHDCVVQFDQSASLSASESAGST